MLRIRPILMATIAIFMLLIQCDRSDSELSEEVLGSLRCEILTNCPQPTTFGLVGDSWTDFAFGAPIQRDLLDTLREEYDYRITASALAGLTFRTEVEEKRGFDSVIRNAGPGLRYMLISLGGNDLLASTGDYAEMGVDTTLDLRLFSLENRLSRMILEGNFLKQQLHGGEPLTWIIHGYDYPNPDKETSCIKGALDKGMPEANAKALPVQILNRYNDFLQSMTAKNVDLRYIDLRSTLSGPPVSNPDLMFDCIHPTTLGHSLIGARYHEVLKGYTNDAR